MFGSPPFPSVAAIAIGDHLGRVAFPGLLPERTVNPTARLVAAVVAVVQLVLAITALITVTQLSGGAVTTRWTSILVPILVLVVLFTPKANAFFGGRR